MATTHRRTVEFLLTAKDKTRAALNSAKTRLDAFGKSVTGVAAQLGIAFTTGAIVAGIRRMANEMDKLAKTASKLGTTTEELSKLQFAAKLTGVSADTLSLGLQRMVRRVSEAAQGAGAAKDALKELGLEAKALNDLRPEAQFKLIADAMSEIPNHTDKVRLAIKIFDTAGAGLLNTLAAGSAGLDEFGHAAERAGAVVDSKAAPAMEQFNDNLEAIGASAGGVGRKIATALVLPINDLYEQITRTREDKLVDAVGLSRDAAKATVAIENIEAAIKELEENSKNFVWRLGTPTWEADLAEMRKSLVDHQKQLQDILGKDASNKQQKEHESSLRDHNRKMDEERKSGLEAEKSTIEAAKQNQDESLKNLQEFQAQRQSLQSEISESVQGITGETGGTEGPVELLDVLHKISEAYASLATDPDAATASIKAGLDLLGRFKEEGGAGEAEIKKLADRFTDLGERVSESQEVDLKGKAEQASAAYEKLKKEIEDGAIAAPVEPEEDAGVKIIEAAQQQIDQSGKKITIPIGISAGDQLPGVMTQADYDDIGGANSTNVRLESLKRGIRL